MQNNIKFAHWLYFSFYFYFNTRNNHYNNLQIIICGKMNRGFGQRVASNGNNSRSFNQSDSTKQPTGFWAKFSRFLRASYIKSIYAYRKSRTLLWVGATGFILLIAPFAFSHFLEISEELQMISMQGAQGMMGQQKGF